MIRSLGTNVREGRNTVTVPLAIRAPQPRALFGEEEPISGAAIAETLVPHGGAFASASTLAAAVGSAQEQHEATANPVVVVGDAPPLRFILDPHDVRMHDNRLHVIGVMSNPELFRRRPLLATEFMSRLAATPGVVLHVVEGSLNANPFQITREGGSTHYRLRLADSMWHKENLANIALSRLPDSWQYGALVDMDITFLLADWLRATLEALQHHPVVQMWSDAVDTGPRGEVLAVFKSFAFCHFHGLPRSKCRRNLMAGATEPGVGGGGTADTATVSSVAAPRAVSGCKRNASAAGLPATQNVRDATTAAAAASCAAASAAESSAGAASLGTATPALPPHSGATNDDDTATRDTYAWHNKGSSASAAAAARGAGVRADAYEWHSGGAEGRGPALPRDMEAPARTFYWHPGYAWAFTRHAMNTLGGFFDAAILGAGDFHFAQALIGDVLASVPREARAACPAYVSKLLAYATRAARLHGDVGYVRGTVKHDHHGPKQKRQYMERWDIFKILKERTGEDFNPDTDIYKDTNGAWRFAPGPRGTLLKRLLRRMFMERDEDSTEP